MPSDQEATVKQAPLLSVRGMQKIYASDHGDVEAIRDLTFDVYRGELVCLVGPSGCGKTTLLKGIAGLMRMTAGTIELEGSPVAGPPKSMAVVFQEYGRSLYPWMRVFENVELPLKNQRVPKQQRRTKVMESLDAVGLSAVARSYPWQLSGGMQQRVAIARAIAYEPSVMLMDEPFAAVDAQTRADLEDLIRNIWQRLGITILFVTHDVEEAVYLGDRVLVMSSSPTVIQDDIRIDLPLVRDQLETKSTKQFVDLRHRVYEQIQIAKRGQPEPLGVGTA